MKTKILIAALAALMAGFVSCTKDRITPATNGNTGSQATGTDKEGAGSASDTTSGSGCGAGTYVPLTGDQIFITVSKTDSMSLGGLDFRYVTGNKYECLNHTLLFDNNFSAQDLEVVFKSVYIPCPEYCTQGEDVASGGTAWYPLADGTHGLRVILDGTTYSGSFEKTGDSYVFTWPYDAGVILSPLVLN